MVPTPTASPGHGGDERLLESRRRANEGQRRKNLCARSNISARSKIAKVGEIVARGEIAARAGEDDGAHRLVTGRRFERDDQCAIHLAVKGILLFGAIHQQAQHPVIPRNDDLFRHKRLQIGALRRVSPKFRGNSLR